MPLVHSKTTAGSLGEGLTLACTGEKHCFKLKVESRISTVKQFWSHFISLMKLCLVQSQLFGAMPLLSVLTWYDNVFRADRVTRTVYRSSVRLHLITVVLWAKYYMLTCWHLACILFWGRFKLFDIFISNCYRHSIKRKHQDFAHTEKWLHWDKQNEKQSQTTKTSYFANGNKL